MCGIGEHGIPVQTTDRDHAFSVLWDAVIGSIDLAKVNSVSRFNQRLKKIEYAISVICSKDSLDVLKHKRRWTMKCDDPREYCNEAVPLVPTASESSG
jgi:hypothetical protein